MHGVRRATPCSMRASPTAWMSLGVKTAPGALPGSISRAGARGIGMQRNPRRVPRFRVPKEGSRTKRRGRGLSPSLATPPGPVVARGAGRFPMYLVVHRDRKLGLSRDRQLRLSRERKLGLGREGQLGFSGERKLRLGLDREIRLSLDRKIRFGLNRQIRFGLDRQVRLSLNREVRFGLDGQIRLSLDRKVRLSLNREVRLSLDRKIRLSLNRQIRRARDRKLWARDVLTTYGRLHWSWLLIRGGELWVELLHCGTLLFCYLVTRGRPDQPAGLW